MYNPKIDALIDGWREEIIETLRGWIAYDSTLAPDEGEGKPFGKVCAEALERALADAEKMGFEVENDAGYAGHIAFGRGERTMGMLAHMDIVPAGDGWTRDPFAGELMDGKLYGRGTADDKGPAVAALFAMRAVRDAGVPMKDGVRLILGCDEETGMKDMRHYAAGHKMPDYGFSPDAEYPLINIEKGGLSIQLSCPCRTDEDDHIPLYELYAGERQNVVPGTARAVVGTANVSTDELRAKLGGSAVVTDLGGARAAIECIGEQAHAAMPYQGKNAAGMLLLALKGLGVGGEGVSALAEKLGMAYDGDALGIAIEDEASGALTCNLGILRMDSRKLTAQLDIRYPIAADEATMCGQMCMALSGTPLSVKRTGGRKPHHIPADHRVVKGLLQVYADITGLPAYPIAIGGGTYSRMMPDTVAFGCCFPGDADLCHMPDEYVEIDKLLLSCKIMAHAIEKLAGA